MKYNPTVSRKVLPIIYDNIGGFCLLIVAFWIVTPSGLLSG
jgi:hypothetical protein